MTQAQKFANHCQQINIKNERFDGEDGIAFYYYNAAVKGFQGFEVFPYTWAFSDGSQCQQQGVGFVVYNGD